MKNENRMNKKIDVIIVGTGVAGLYTALNLGKDKNILMITKDKSDASDSFLAQGGICVLKNDNDYQSFFEDTMKAGHYENNKKSVDLMIRTSPEIIQHLIQLGVEFENRDGELIYTKEGAHSKARIVYHKDLTGKEITSKLLAEVKKKENIKILEYTMMVDLLCYDNQCKGVVTSNNQKNIESYEADYVVLASGGLGGLFDHSTNLKHITGDALAISMKNNITIKNISYIQIHPTTLFSKKTGRHFLISESVRGEGAILLNKEKKRFVDELLPRDLVTKAIYKEMEEDHQEFVWLSLESLSEEIIKKRFPNIYLRCLEEGYDITKECIPVVPAQHYLMGGIQVDLNGETSMNHLYAVGEISCNGVHGANRLASNSLLESLVFSKRAANDIINKYESSLAFELKINYNDFMNLEELRKKYKKIILDEIKRCVSIEKSYKKA